MRSILTCLGIIIGIAAVIAMMEIGRGSSNSIEKSIASLGANVIQIEPGSSSVGGVNSGSGGRVTLTPLDCEAILKDCSAVRSIAPSVDCRAQVVYGNRNWSPNNVLGSTPDYLVVRNWGLSGDPLADEPDDDVIVGIDDDPCPRRRHARRVLQRLLRMGKVGANYHTAADHLYRGVPADQRHEAMDVGEALIRAGLLGEKPSVGQRHVYLRRDALPQIHALIERGESTAPALTELWTAPAPQRHPTPPNRAT